MTKSETLPAKARNNPAGVRFSELCLLAERYGFRKKGGKGSHVVYVRDEVEEILVFQNVKGKAKPYQVRQFLTLLDKYRWREQG